ncbi:MAG: cyanophycin synthetase [Burkholderiales bacterium]
MPKNIEFLHITDLRGPNLWSYDPVMEMIVDIGDLEDWPSDRIPGYPERLQAWLPTLEEHRCSYGERGGFLRRLQEGTWPAHVLEHVTLEIQSLAGVPGGFGRAREAGPRGVYKVAVTSRDGRVTRAAVEAARELVLAAMDDRPFDVAAAIARVRKVADRHWLGPSTAAIVLAAETRTIPAIRLNEGNLVQLGYGSRARRIWTAETDRTSAIAEGISRDKHLTNSLLSACGVPVPEGRVVASAADAWEAAREIDAPVVVKPIDGNHGRGVFIGLTTQTEVEAAWAIAIGEGSGVLVERAVPGREHRLLVVGGKMVAASRGEAAYVTGDGHSTIATLIDTQLNSDPRRGETQDHPLNPVRLDSIVRLDLQHQGCTPESVPAEGVQVLIQRNGNMSVDITDDVHPEVAAKAALAARIVGLDIAGIDLVAEDITRPLAEQRGAIVEVNAGPGLIFHLRPSNGPGRPVGEAIVAHLFPQGDDGRIPVVGIAGSADTTPAARLVAHLLSLRGLRTGLVGAMGLWLEGRRVEGRDAAHFDAARKLLTNRSLEAAVIESSLRTLAIEGLAYDWCQVGVVTGLDPRDVMPEHRVVDADDLYKVLRTQVDVVLPTGTAVVNADDPVVGEMASLSKGAVIPFSAGPFSEQVAVHCEKGGQAVYVRHGRLTVAQGANEVALAPMDALPAVRAYGAIPVLAAAAAGLALGLSPELIRTGLETFAAVAANGADAVC